MIAEKTGGAVEDPCDIMQGRLGAHFCEDPYFGGNPECCFNMASGKCQSCGEVENGGLANSESSRTTCSRDSELVCTQKHILECGSQQSLGDTMWHRRESCIYPDASASPVRPLRAYWSAAYDFVLEGSFQQIRAQSGVASLQTCVTLCEDEGDCAAVAYNSVDGLCVLQQGEVTRVCDPVNGGCTMTKNDGVFFVRDSAEVRHSCCRNEMLCLSTHPYLACARKSTDDSCAWTTVALLQRHGPRMRLHPTFPELPGARVMCCQQCRSRHHGPVFRVCLERSS